jgi:hypothetical protein
MALSTGIDVVRTHYFGSIATNYDAQDQDAVQRRSEFFDSLRRHHRYEVYRFETDYRGHRVRRTPGDDGFSPPEKAVDVGLATSLLEMAALSAYDIAIVVCGDRDFVPALQAVRRLGKRVALVSARGSCARELSDPNDPVRLRDFDILWLDQLWAQVVSPVARPVQRTLSEQTVTDRDAADIADDSLYADDGTSFTGAGATSSSVALPGEQADAPELHGVITKVHAHGYGFVRADDGLDYYFRRADFADGSAFTRLERYRTRVSFRVSEPSSGGQAGRAAALSIVGVSETPVLVPRSAAPRDGAPRDGAAREGWTPVSAPAIAEPDEATGALWADDPFAAPRRPGDPVVTAEPAAVPPAEPRAEPTPDVPAGVSDLLHASAEPAAPPAVKKRRAPARKSVST